MSFTEIDQVDEGKADIATEQVQFLHSIAPEARLYSARVSDGRMFTNPEIICYVRHPPSLLYVY
jgi:hypothetical protein